MKTSRFAFALVLVLVFGCTLRQVGAVEQQLDASVHEFIHKASSSREALASAIDALTNHLMFGKPDFAEFVAVCGKTGDEIGQIVTLDKSVADKFQAVNAATFWEARKSLKESYEKARRDVPRQVDDLNRLATLADEVRLSRDKPRRFGRVDVASLPKVLAGANGSTSSGDRNWNIRLICNLQADEQTTYTLYDAENLTQCRWFPAKYELFLYRKMLLSVMDRTNKSIGIDAHAEWAGWQIARLHFQLPSALEQLRGVDGQLDPEIVSLIDELSENFSLREITALVTRIQFDTKYDTNDDDRRYERTCNAISKAVCSRLPARLEAYRVAVKGRLMKSGFDQIPDFSDNKGLDPSRAEDQGDVLMTRTLAQCERYSRELAALALEKKVAIPGFFDFDENQCRIMSVNDVIPFINGTAKLPDYAEGYPRLADQTAGFPVTSEIYEPLLFELLGDLCRDRDELTWRIETTGGEMLLSPTDDMEIDRAARSLRIKDRPPVDLKDVRRINVVW